jgi:ABC-type Fe3+ transport system substrate-binding protein
MLLPWSVLALLVAMPFGHAHAQTSPLATIASYSGADRAQRVIDGAKKEGALTLYSSGTHEDIGSVIYAFEKKYGLPVRFWRGSSEDILRRTMTEARASRFEVDVADTAGPEMEAMQREKLLHEITSPVFAELMAQAVAPRRAWVMSRLNVFTAAANTNMVSAADAPRSYHDLTDRGWKGRLGIEADDVGWFLTVLGIIGEEKGLELFRGIVTKNGMSVRKGHTLLANLVAAGEVPLALTVYGFLAEQAKRKGAPLDWFVLPPAVARMTAQGLARNAPHPHAALLFFDFLIGEGQQLLASRQFVTVTRKIESPIDRGSLRLIDSAAMLDQARKWQDLYQRTIIGASR